ncbi:hypothetical protein GW17_00011542, partial [Ensete ventricosum]
MLEFTSFVGLTKITWSIHQKKKLTSRAEQLYEQVEEMILEDSRIDQYPKLIKGESKVVLEWQVDGPLTSMLKSKESASKTKAITTVDRSFGNEEKKPVI